MASDICVGHGSPQVLSVLATDHTDLPLGLQPRITQIRSAERWVFSHGLHRSVPRSAWVFSHGLHRSVPRSAGSSATDYTDPFRGALGLQPRITQIRSAERLGLQPRITQIRSAERWVFSHGLHRSVPRSAWVFSHGLHRFVPRSAWVRPRILADLRSAGRSRQLLAVACVRPSECCRTPSVETAACHRS
jgi:hypothetical protein